MLRQMDLDEIYAIFRRLSQEDILHEDAPVHGQLVNHALF